VVAVMYFLICFPLTSLSRSLERRLGGPDHPRAALATMAASR
jgi:hypothetical protein